MIPVREEFLTIQGEGASVGKLSYFIRLAGCNLRCSWCDSLHAVDPKQYLGKTSDFSATRIPDQATTVVITGGEPTLFDLQYMITEIKAKKSSFRIEVESNATRFLPELSEQVFWNLSPKLRSSNQPTAAMNELRTRALTGWVTAIRTSKLSNVIFKFVVASPDDKREVLEIVNTHEIPHELVYLMPEGRTAEQQLKTSDQVIALCKEHGFNFSPRLHVLLWNDERGK